MGLGHRVPDGPPSQQSASLHTAEKVPLDPEDAMKARQDTEQPDSSESC